MKKEIDDLILTRQELQIMKVVWALGRASVREVCEKLNQAKPTAYTTVLTLMGILEEKGALRHLRSGRAFIFEPLLSRDQATKNQIQDLVGRLFDGRPEALVREVIKKEIIDPEKIQQLLEEFQPDTDRSLR